MRIGVPREVKQDEYRVALLPVGAELLTRQGHEVVIESGAGEGSGFSNGDYAQAGAQIVSSAAACFAQFELIVKVKEPQPQEISLLQPHHVLFCYFHFAASRELTQDCLNAGFTALAYETLFDDEGHLPLLQPMSEIAGKLSIQEGAKCLEKTFEGRGVLLGGVPGVEPANVLVLGGGVVGTNAARMAAGLGANVIIMDVNLNRLRHLDEVMPANVTTLFSDPHTIRNAALRADLVIGAVLIPGARTPVLLDAGLIRQMKTGAVLVDVGIDQGGCAETSRPTTHQAPTYVVDGVVHYCVTNMPGVVSRTSSQALCNATLPYIRELAAEGVDQFLSRSAGRKESLNMRGGRLTNAQLSSLFKDLPA